MHIQSLISKSVFAVVISAATLSSAFADTIIRDHRGPVVRDHRDPKCIVGLPCVRDHRDPQGGVIVVPPPVRQPPVVRPPVIQPPVVVIDTPQPTIPLDPGIGNGTGGYDEDTITCREGRRIVKNFMRHKGFKKVAIVDCSQPTYTYFAKKRHSGAYVKVNMDGDIVAVNYLIY